MSDCCTATRQQVVHETTTLINCYLVLFHCLYFVNAMAQREFGVFSKAALHDIECRLINHNLPELAGFLLDDIERRLIDIQRSYIVHGQRQQVRDT